MTRRGTAFSDSWFFGRRLEVDGHDGSVVTVTLRNGSAVTGTLVAAARPHGSSDRDAGVAVLWTGGIDLEYVAVDLDDIQMMEAAPKPPHTTDSRAVWRVAGSLAAWANQRRGKRLTELPPQDLGEGLGLARAFAAVIQSQSFGGQGEQYEGDLAFLADAVTYARQVDDAFRVWVSNTTKQPVELPKRAEAAPTPTVEEEDDTK